MADTPPFELSRPFPVDRTGEGIRFDVEAKPAEREAVARRMGLVSIASLTCSFELKREPGHVMRANGALRADVVQTCVVTLEPFEAVVAEDFTVRFVPEGQESEEVDIESEDEVPYAGGVIDLGEATSEQLALALDPFPRRPGAELPEEEVEQAEGPFAALRGRKN